MTVRARPFLPPWFYAGLLAVSLAGCGAGLRAPGAEAPASLAGPPVQPFFCATPTPRPATATTPATNASGLSRPPAGADCSTPAETFWYYRSTDADCSLALPDPSPAVAPDATDAPAPPPPRAGLCFKAFRHGDAPADLAHATNAAGARVPYVVRVERGVLGRGIYDIAVLADPSAAQPDRPPALLWTGKVYYQFGAGTGLPRRQTRPAVPWTQADAALARGYLVAANGLTDSSANADRILMADVLARMKAHIATQYGPIRFTLGTGGSGGAINAQVSGSLRPGLLDGAVVVASFADAQSTMIEVSDCQLLVEAYQRPAWRALMAAQGTAAADEAALQAAINGHVDPSGCRAWFGSFGGLAQAGQYQRRSASLTDGTLRSAGAPVNNCQLPAARVYDRDQRPGGARCDIAGATPPAIGPTLDNEGVLYGWAAFKVGAITPEAFVVINESIGGLDRDGRLQPQRSRAEPEALALAYRSGLVADGHALSRIALIEVRGWDDSALIVQPGSTATPALPIHHVWRSFSTRARLLRDTGGTAGHALWRIGRGGVYAQAVAPRVLDTMDRWLSTLAADRSDRPLPLRVAAARPADARDFCLRSDDPGQADERQGSDCDGDPFLQAHASPRQVAGGPLTEDVLKCRLRPLADADLQGLLDATQAARLRAVFVSGVCDWRLPGVGQQASVAPMDFSGAAPIPAMPETAPAAARP